SGYTITYNNVLESIKCANIIPNVDAFNIICDDQIGVMAIKHQFIEYHKILKYEYTIESLHLACELSNVNLCESSCLKYVRHVISTRLVPDAKCMDIAIEKKNQHLIAYLIKICGLKVTRKQFCKFL